jgi:TolA-binding protein
MRAILFAATAVVAFAPGLAGAQSIEGRVGKLESEMRAVQRKVFPGGAGQLLQPEIERAPQGIEPPPGASASSPVADLTARVASLEGQIATMTGQIEQNQFRLRQLDESFTAYKSASDARLRTLEDRAAAPVPAARAAEPVSDAEPAPTRAVGRPGAEPATAAAVLIEQDTGDAGEDAYMLGYRLWTAKRYAEAETQLKKVVAAHPKHRRASYAQNLLGRSYLDSGKPSLASIAFYDNYKKMPAGERAPDSLYYLAQALQTLKKPADACKVYGELTDVYGAKIDARMKADIARGRAAAKCS